MSQIKILQDLPQGEPPQREERLRKTCDFMQSDLPLGQNTQREERLREKRKMILIKSHQDLPQGELLRREERLRKTFFVKKHKRVFLSLSSLCVIYPGERSVRINTQKGLSQSFFSLWKLSLRQILEFSEFQNFHLGHFMFFSLSLFSLCGSAS